MTADELRAFERRVADAFERREIRAPVHLAGGNEEKLIRIFKRIHPEDWVFCSYRNHYHALLHGIPEAEVWDMILAGRSMNMCFPQYRFYCSAIVAGQVPMAVGVAAALKRQASVRRVWCFLGDMAARTGICYEGKQYAARQRLLLTFVTEDNRMSCNTPTEKAWGLPITAFPHLYYDYERKYPHVGIGKWVTF